MVEIAEVAPGSRADKAGILPGDCLVTLNGHEIRDVLDYRFYLTESHVALTVLRHGKSMTFSLKKPRYDDIGLSFATFLMDEKRACRNKCIFCFIDQLPKGMRETLYFKDDDSRLSFLMGNYITLTNMDEHDIERIIDMKMSPINISVHATDPDLRCRMLSNRFAGSCYETMKRFSAAGIEMHCQIVLCRGVNDGAALDRTMDDLAKLYPAVSSVSVVPVGLTKFREGLYPLAPFDREDAVSVIEKVDAFASRCCERYGTRLFFLGDEWYLKAGIDIPSADAYEEYPQIENGVGMIRSMADEVSGALGELLPDAVPRACSLATGYAAYPLISSLVDAVKEKLTRLDCPVYSIKNEFFGEEITVAGLITGQDLYRQLKGKKLGRVLLLPAVMLRYERDRFLDDTTPEWLSDQLGVKIVFIENDGYEFVETIRNESLCEGEQK